MPATKDAFILVPHLPDATGTGPCHGAGCLHAPGLEKALAGQAAFGTDALRGAGKKRRPCRVAEGASVKVRKGIGKGVFIPGVRAGKHRGSPEAARKVPKHREVPGRRGECRSRFRAPAGKRPKRRGAAGETSESAGIGPGTRRRSCKDAPRTPRSAAEKPGAARKVPKRREVPGMPGRPGGSPGG